MLTYPESSCFTPVFGKASNHVRFPIAKVLYGQVLYRWRCTDAVKVLVALLNGRGSDVAATLNPQAGAFEGPVTCRDKPM